MTTPTLFDCYKAARQWKRETPAGALSRARDAFKRGRLPTVPRGPAMIGHGDVIRRNGRTFVVSIVPDSDMGPPWENEDGHGPVSDWTRRAKAPGELILCSDRGSHRYYDFADAIRIAKRDGWGSSPYALESETKGQKAARAAMADFERLKAWCDDGWHYVGVCLFELPHDGVERSAQHVADAAPFGILDHRALWGIESDSPEYHSQVALELVSEF